MERLALLNSALLSKFVYIGTGIVTTLLAVVLQSASTSAAVPPDTCFTLSGSTITNYSTASECPKELTIPATINGVTPTALSYAAFWEKGLTSVDIQAPLTTIGNAAFWGNLLTTVTIPNTVTSIGSNAFNRNDLTSVTISNSVESIGAFAFTNNYLSHVTIPASVTTIGHEAFSANQLRTATILGNPQLSVPWAFGDALVALSNIFAQNGLDRSVTASVMSQPERVCFSDNNACNALYRDNAELVRVYAPNASSFPSDGYGFHSVTINGVPDQTVSGIVLGTVSLTLRYVNTAGADIAPSTTTISADPTITSYKIADVRTQLPGASGALTQGIFYTLGDTVTPDVVAFPVVASYQAPSSAAPVTLAAPDTTVAIIYSGGSVAPPTNDSTPIPSTPAPEPTTTINSPVVADDTVVIRAPDTGFPRATTAAAERRTVPVFIVITYSILLAYAMVVLARRTHAPWSQK